MKHDIPFSTATDRKRYDRCYALIRKGLTIEEAVAKMKEPKTKKSHQPHTDGLQRHDVSQHQPGSKNTADTPPVAAQVNLETIEALLGRIADNLAPPPPIIRVVGTGDFDPDNIPVWIVDLLTTQNKMCGKVVEVVENFDKTLKLFVDTLNIVRMR